MVALPASPRQILRGPGPQFEASGAAFSGDAGFLPRVEASQSTVAKFEAPTIRERGGALHYFAVEPAAAPLEMSLPIRILRGVEKADANRERAARLGR